MDMKAPDTVCFQPKPHIFQSCNSDGKPNGAPPDLDLNVAFEKYSLEQKWKKMRRLFSSRLTRFPQQRENSDEYVETRGIA